jgi:dTMP kinase
MVRSTREPGGTLLGASLRELLLNAATPTDPWAEAFLFEADRAQTSTDVIEPALEAGEVVISDRGPFGTIAYQAFGRRLDLQLIEKMNSIAWKERVPDLVVVIDVEPEIGMQRKARGSERDRFDEEDLAFQTRAREGYLYAASRRVGSTLVVDGGAPLDEVIASVIAAARDTLERKLDGS